MTTNHTPTPWYSSTEMDGRHQCYSILTAHEDFEDDDDTPYHPLIAQTLHGKGFAPKDIAKANAAFIVKACNAHDDLVGACQTALSNLTLKYPEDHLVMKRLKAALAKAQAQ